MSRVIKEIFKSKTEEFCYKVGGKTLFGALVQVASEDGFSLESETYYDADGEEIDPTTVEEIDCDCAVRPTQVIIESSCDDPTYIAGCPDNPIPVEITNPPSDYEYVNSGWICGEGDTWVTTTTVYIDGVAGEPVVTDSGISCEEPAPLDQIDTEKLEICDPITKTIHIKVCQYTTSYDDDGVPTTVENEISYTDTNVKCDVDVVDVDTEFVCNTDTNVWDMTQVTTTNGVPADPVVTPTTTPCDEDKPDFEQPRVCRDGTVHILTNQIDIDGTVTELSAVDTGEECNQQPKTIQCLKDQFIEGGLDNSFTNFTHTNQIFTTLFSDGSVDTFNIASATGWTDQVSQMAVGLGSIMPWAQTVDPFCTNGCGGLPAPFVELNEMVARYVGFRVCPADVVPKSVIYTSDQTKEPIELVIQYVVTDPIYIDRCVSCDGEESFKVKGEDYSPVCPVPCTDVAPEVPIPTCQIIDTLSVCVATLEEDEELNVEPVLVESDVFLSFTDCGDGAITSNAYTIDADGTAVPYELAPENYFANCETLEPVSPPPPECPEGAQFSPVQLPAARYGIQDNSRYTLLDGSILNHLQNGNDYEYTYSYQGTTVAVHQQTSDPYYNDLINTGEASIGCSIKAICANHTSPKGCNANQVANLADYPAYDSPTFPADVQNNLTNPDQDELWASGWMLECAGCNKEIDRVTITKSNNPDHVGAYKDLTFYEKEPEIVYQAITCAGTFYKGCDGNDIADPTSGCCVTAPTAPADMSWWECFKAECGGNAIPDDLPSTLSATGINPDLNLNQTGTGVTNWLDLPAIFDGDNTTYSSLSVDNTDGQSNGLNANTFTFDLAGIPECAEIEGDVTVKVHARMNNIIGDGGFDAIWASVTGANGPIAPTSVTAGTQGAPYGNAYVFMGVPDNTYVVSNGLAPVGGADYYEFTVPMTVADLLAGGIQIGTDNDMPNVDGGDPQLAGIEIDVVWNTENCPAGDGECALRTSGCNDDRRDDLLSQLVDNTTATEECSVELTSEPQCLDGEQTITMVDGSTRTLSDGDYITIVQFFDCKGTLVNILYYETANPDVAMDTIPQLSNCEPAPTVREVCLIDAKGIKWIATEYRDENGIIVGTPFYLDEDGSIGTPAGDESEWRSCDPKTLEDYETDCPLAGDLWYLLSKFRGTPEPHPNASDYGDTFTLISAEVRGEHPVTGDSVDGYSFYAMCSDSQPATDDNGHEWFQVPDPQNTTFEYAGGLDFPVCEGKKVIGTVGCLDQAILDKLCAIEELLKDDCIDLDVGRPTLLDGETGESTGTIVQFPHVTPAGQLADFITPISLPADDCLTALDPATKIRVRLCWNGHDLETGANGTTGAQVIMGPLDSSGDAEIVGWSGTNTTTQNTTGNPNGFMGTIATGLDVADRWIDWDVPLQDLLDGTTITTSAFGGTNTGVTETLASQEVKILTDLTQFECKQCEECC